jgi:hypothetical protein
MPNFSAGEWILLIGTLFTGIGTCATAYVAIKKAKSETRSEAEIDCLEKLRQARLEEANAQDELYELRKRQREA